MRWVQVKGTGRWFLKHLSLGPGAMANLLNALFVASYGIPGAGKTVIGFLLCWSPDEWKEYFFLILQFDDRIPLLHVFFICTRSGVVI
jgi:hypothetical protein